MTNAQIAENFVAEMISRIKRRMDSFGDSYGSQQPTGSGLLHPSTTTRIQHG